MSRQGSIRNRSSRLHSDPPRRGKSSRRKTLDPAWQAEYDARLADPSWQKRKDLYYSLHAYRCRGCRRRHDLNLHHKSYRRMVRKIGPGQYKRIWAEEDRDFVYACKRCHKRVHVYQHRLAPGTHFGLRTVTSLYLATRLFFHYLGYLALTLVLVAALSTAVIWQLSPTTLHRITTCIESSVDYRPPPPAPLPVCR